MIHGREGEQATWIDPRLAALNHEAALTGSNIRGNLIEGQKNSFAGTQSALDRLRLAPSAQQMTNVGIEQQRRNVDNQSYGQGNQLNQILARRGSANTVGGLSQILSQGAAKQNALNQMEFGRTASEQAGDNANIARHGALLGQLGGASQLTEMPMPQYMTPGKDAKKGLLGGALGAVGSIFGGMFGGAVGAQGGGTAGTAVGDSASGEYQRRQYQPTNYG